MRSPATRENSAVLWVTSVRPLSFAMAAIIRSFGPINPEPRSPKTEDPVPQRSAWTTSFTQL